MRWFLRRLLPPSLPKPQPKYVGVVHGYTLFRGKDGESDIYMDGWWVLSETAGKRTAKAVGDPSTSPLAIAAKTEVEAWLVGGPIPRLGNKRDGTPPPKPRKTKPVAKRADNVIAFAKKSA